MLADLFWNVATSSIVLGIIGLVLAASLVVGYFPLLKWFPIIGQYVPVARLVVIISAALLCFLVGFRLSDEREEAKSLAAQLIIKQADLDAAKQAASDEAKRATFIEASANDQRSKDAAYIATLEARPACALNDNDLGGVPDNKSRTSGKKPAGGSR